MKRRYPVFLLLLSLAFLNACESSQSATPRASAAATPVPAPAPAPPAQQDYFQTNGPIVVENQVDVAAQREGVVAEIHAEVGQAVHQGELLASLDDRQLAADRQAAEAHVRSSQFELDHWDAEVKVLGTDLQRDQAMYDAQLITVQQLDHSRYRLDSAKFEREREKQNLVNAQAAFRSLELELAKDHIVAPFDGVVARRYVRAGQKVAVNDRLFWITAVKPLNVKFTLPQEFVGRIRRGDLVTVVAPAAGAEPHDARVTLISPVVDPSSGTIEVEARLAGEPADLSPGMTANVRVNKAR